MATRSTSAKSDDQQDKPTPTTADTPVVEPETVVHPAQYDDINYGAGAPEGTDPKGGIGLDNSLRNATGNSSSTAD